MKIADLEVRLSADAGPFATAMRDLRAVVEGMTIRPTITSAAEAARIYNATVRWLRRGKHRWMLGRGARIHPNGRRRPKRQRR